MSIRFKRDSALDFQMGEGQLLTLFLGTKNRKKAVDWELIFFSLFKELT